MSNLPEIKKEELGIVKSMIFPDASDAELALFLYECKRRGVHPLERRIIPIKRKDGESGLCKVTFQCTIDYLRSLAATSAEYGGQDEPVFGPDKDGYPAYAKVAVYRKDVERPFVGVAYWSEYYPGEKLGWMWRRMPHNQLAKCAEALALRKAFPQTLAGLYTDVEFARQDAGATVGSLIEATEKAIEQSGQSDAAPEKIPEKVTVKQVLKETLEKLAPGDIKAQAEYLKQASIFGQGRNQKYIDGIENIDAVSDKWCQFTLDNLRRLSGND